MIKDGLHPQARKILDLIAESDARDLETMSPVAARFMFDMKAPNLNLPTVEVRAVEALEIPGPAGALRARLYRPQGASSAPLPVLVFFHGGGYVIGSLKSHDPQCRYLCREADCLVLSVDYRLAPDHKFPAAVEDAFAAVRWAAETAPALGGDPARLALCGDSAGGNLTAVCCHMARDQGGPAIALQAMIYPNLDIFADLPSHALFDEDLILTRPIIDWFVAHYLNGENDRTDPRFAPLRYADFTGLPPAVIVTAEFDPLRDEGAAYADALAAADIPVDYTCQAGQIHNFLLWGEVIDAAPETLDRVAARLRQVFAGEGVCF
ncbi:MAG: alpha/beta hydrolase [Alphaproteobacteria bacterium]|nr:alpha/beta hydrolase [Alphaproteobacteria bacterium]